MRASLAMERRSIVKVNQVLLASTLGKYYFVTRYHGMHHRRYFRIIYPRVIRQEVLGCQPIQEPRLDLPRKRCASAPVSRRRWNQHANCRARWSASA